VSASASSFYEPLGGQRFVATTATAGPWSDSLQHGGPPSALLVRAMELLPGPPGRLARVTTEFLSPVPVAELEVSAEVVRDGASVQLLTASLRAKHRTVLRATAWRLRTVEPGSAPATSTEPAHQAPPLPDADHFPSGFTFPYAEAIPWRFVEGSPTTPGPATTWARMRIPLVAGEPTTALQQAVVVTDSGSGVSAALNWNEWSFVNVDLTVHLAREPRPGWVCIESATTLAGEGTGFAGTRLYDEGGWFGTCAQSLLVAPRRRGR
jgi:hypothetical protein